jgi:hypothetical protein
MKKELTFLLIAVFLTLCGSAEADVDLGVPEYQTASYDFPNGKLSGVITYQVPDKAASGSMLTTDVTYYVVLNKDTIGKGVAKPGTVFHYDATALHGWNEIKTRAANEHGWATSEASVSFYAGYDKLLNLYNTLLKFDKKTNTSTLVWRKLYRGVNGGYVNPDSIGYEVVRMPEGKVVANTVDTTFTETLPAEYPYDEVYYEMTAYNGKANRTDDPKVTNHAYLKTINVPYFQDFANESSLIYFTTVSTTMSYWTYGYESDVKYVSGSDNDAWLISPGIRLEVGKVYNISYVYHSDTYGQMPDEMESAYGQTNYPDNYIALMPATQFQTKNHQHFAKGISVKQTGDYYFGFHVITKGYGSYVSLDSLSVEASSSTAAPDSVTALKVVAGDKGALMATVSFTCPTMAFDGTQLSSLTKVEVKRGSQIIKTFAQPTAGESLQYVDNEAPNGMQTYTVVPYNSEGKGTEASASAYVGYDVPTAPRNIHLTDSYDGKTVTISWQKPDAKGANGGYVDVNALTYTIVNMNGQLVDNELTSTTYDDDYTSVLTSPATNQQLVWYGVQAVSNELGKGSEVGKSDMLVAGTAYSYPFHESFSGLTQENPFSWQVVYPTGSDNPFILTRASTADYDDGSIYWVNQNVGDSAYYNTGKISLFGAKNAHIIFRYYAFPGHDMNLSLIVDEGSMSTTNVFSVDYRTLTGNEGWRYVDVPITNLGGPYIILKFRCQSNETVAAHRRFALDDINVRDVYPNDMKVSYVSSTDKIRVNSPMTVTAVISNQGEATAKNYTVNLFVNDKKVTTIDNASQTAMTDSVYTLKYSPNVMDSGTIKAYVTVEISDDANMNDNTSSTLSVEMVENKFPTVTATGKQNGTNVKIDWAVPDLSDSGKTTEDFEDYALWSTSDIGGWTLIDRDKAPVDETYVVNGDPCCALIWSNKALGANVDDPTGSAYSPYLAAHSGQDVLYSTMNTEFRNNADKTGTVLCYDPTDNWMISPELSGKAQTIDYYTKSAYGNANHFELLYSTSDTNPDNFLLVKKDSFYYDETFLVYKHISFDVPEGARYFAIRETTVPDVSHIGGLYIDDVSFDATALVVKGFRIYRDGMLIAEVGATDLTFTDDNAGDGNHHYMVSVVYDKGESRPVDVDVVGTGISNIMLDGHAFDIYDINGMKVRTAAHDFNGLSRGIYIVNGKKYAVR